MNTVQRFFTAILPSSWVEEMRRESQSWMLHCTCGYERSVWEAGGVRWKARGNPRRLMACPKCGKKTWHTVFRKADSV